MFNSKHLNRQVRQNKWRILIYLLLANMLAIIYHNAVVWKSTGNSATSLSPHTSVMGKRREFVKSMMKDAWDDYEKNAWGENELRPISEVGNTEGIFGSSPLGLTIVDSLDTLFIMGLEQEFARAKKWIKDELDLESVTYAISVFETNIRYLGGFLSAYALTGEGFFRKKAEGVGRMLLPAFNTPNGLPFGMIIPATKEAPVVQTNFLADIGSITLEFTYLSHITGDPIFVQKARVIRDFFRKLDKFDGLYPDQIDVQKGLWYGARVRVGGGSDSFYEYLLKSWIQTGDSTSRQMYDDAVDAFVSNGLVKVSKRSRLLYLAEKYADEKTYYAVGEHLQCFAGGLFALGAVTAPKNGGRARRDFEMGINFTNTCHETYVRTKTRLGPEIFRFTDDLEAQAHRTDDRQHLLRPEVIESYFYLYRLTKDPKYQEWGWDAAKAIQKYAKVGTGKGYSCINDVDNIGGERFTDNQPSYFLAETLKNSSLSIQYNSLSILQ